MRSKIIKTKNGTTILLTRCAVCNSKKSNFLKEQEEKGSLRSLGIKVSLNKLSLLGKILF